MKHTKKLVGILLALVMVLALTSTAMAYTIDTTDDRTYEVYQIFTGDLDDSTLSNVLWGLNGTGTTGEAVDSTITEELENAGGTDTAQLAVIKKYVDLTTEPYGEVTAAQPLENVPAGYYLIKDVDGVFENQHDAYTLYIVKIVGDVTIDPKFDVPSLEKKADDKNDSNTLEDGIHWEDSVDYDIGDAVPFKITATMPGNYSDYTKYTLSFVDTMAKGLTYDADTAELKVMVGDVEITSYFTTDVTADGDNTVLTVSCDDVKAIDGITNGCDIVMTYKAILNTDAAHGAVGNHNTAKLVFSNDPNWQGAPEDAPKGETPEDTVVVFTYKTTLNKVDPEGAALAGASFKLEKKLADGSWKFIKEYTAGTETTFEFTGLDDGHYKLTETVNPSGYNAIAPIEFSITATHSEENADPVLESLAGASLVDGAISFDVDTGAGSLTANVVNNRGAILPETGGIGTTIFYILGGLLVVGAIVLLVTRKRMHN